MLNHWAVRATLAGLLIATVVLLLGIQAREAADRSQRRLGFEITLGDATDGLTVAAVEPGLPADRGGLAPGDRIVAVDGAPLGEVPDYDHAAARFERGEPVVFTVRRDGGELRLELVPGVAFPWGGFLLDLLALICYLGLGLVALGHAASDLRARLLFLFAAAVSIELVLPYDAIGPARHLASLVFYLVTGLEMGLELHLASVIPHRARWLGRFLVPLYYVVGLALAGLAALTYGIEDLAGRDLFPWTSLGAERLLLEVGLPVWAVGVALILAVQARDATSPRGRQQALLVLAGVVPWVAYVLLSLVVEWSGGVLGEPALALETVVLLFYPVAVLLAIFRYRLFDIELAARRGLVYSALTGILVLLFYGLVGGGGAVLSRFTGERPSIWFVSAVTLGLGLAVAPLRRLLQRQIDRRFFPERHALRRRLISLAGELPGLGKLPLMGARLVEALRASFGLRAVELLIAEPATGRLAPIAAAGTGRSHERPVLLPQTEPGIEFLQRMGRPVPVEQVSEVSPVLAERLEIERGSFVVPLVSQEELIGLLVAGPKHRGERFPREEVELLALMAHHAATVFQNARLFESATYEGLTGLLRREAILDILDGELDRALRYGRPLTVAMADLDHFKVINDRYGHLVGDTLLKEVAGVIASGLRSTDAVGRYGGEEFLLVLPETELAGARVVAEKVRRLVEALAIAMEDGEEVGMTISIGLASLGQRDLPEEPVGRDLLAAADRALYEAKEKGRNRIHPPLMASVG